MNYVSVFTRKVTLGIVAVIFGILLSGCHGYSVPITAKPTHKIDERFLGTWTSKEGSDTMKVFKFDKSHYLVTFQDGLVRAYHSDLAKTPFITAQPLDENAPESPKPGSPKTESSNPQYFYFVCTLSDDGVMHLKSVSDKLIPTETKSSATVRRLLKKNLLNPALFDDEALFIKDKADAPKNP